MFIVEFTFSAIAIALAAAFFLSLAYKWGIIEEMQIRGSELISEMAKCQFCLSFWTGVILSVLYAIFLQDAIMLFCPIFSTVLTKKLL